MPHEALPRVTYLGGGEGSMQQKLQELMDICTSLQMQHSIIEERVNSQDLEITQLKTRVKTLEDNERRREVFAQEDAPNTGGGSRGDLLVGDTVKDSDKSADKGSDSANEMANVLGTLGAANILASRGLRSVFTTASLSVATAGTGVSPAVATASGSFPTTAIFTTASVATPTTRVIRSSRGVTSKEKVLEQMSVQLARDLEAKFTQEDQIIREQAERDSEIDRIHAERELEMMIAKLDRSNEMVAKYLSEYEQDEAGLSHDEKVKLIDKLLMYQRHLAQINKYQAQQNNPTTKTKRRNFYMSILRSNAGWKAKDFKGMSFEQIEEKFIPVWEKMQDFVPMNSKLESERLKRPGIQLDKERFKKLKTAKATGTEPTQVRHSKEPKELSEEELKKMMELVPVEELYIEALQVKYPIIYWEIYSEDQRTCWKIIRVRNHTEVYQIFENMLKKFDREDLDKLWSLVKETCSTSEGTDEKAKELYVELKRLYEPDSRDPLWALQRWSIKFRGGLLGIKCSKVFPLLDKLPLNIEENPMFQRLSRYPTSVRVFLDPIIFLAGLKPLWEHEMAFRNFIYTEDDDDLAFLPKEPSLGFEVTVDSGESPKVGVFVVHPGSVAAHIKERKCKTRGGSSRPPVKRKLASGSSSSRDVRLLDYFELKDANVCHLKISVITPPSWKGHLDNQMDLELLDLYDRCYVLQDVVDNAVNRKAREFLQVIEKMSGEADVINAGERSREEECEGLRVKCEAAMAEFDHNPIVLALREKISSLTVDVKEHKELLHSDELGRLVGKLVSFAITYGHCRAYEQVAAMKDPLTYQRLKDIVLRTRRIILRLAMISPLLHSFSWTNFYTKFYNSLGRAPNRCSGSIGKARGLLSFTQGTETVTPSPTAENVILRNVGVVPGLMAYFVTSLTSDSTRSYVMQSASLTQRIGSNIPMIFSWGSSIGPEGFMPSILLLVVIIVVVVVIVIIICGVPSIIKLSFMVIGWAYAFHQDKASSVRVPVANVTLFSSAQLLRENTDLVCSNQRMRPTASSVPLK
nr:hypothetical protein [Tanacetum cinerariifolium]